jgi:DNA-directed RNA polymerase subunit M/transcription elongation factor TFIIS
MNEQTEEPMPGQWIMGVDCRSCGKALSAERQAQEFQLTCDKCGAKHTYQPSEVQMRQRQI